MEKEKPEVKPSTPAPSNEEKTPRPSRRPRPSQNILCFLLNRQLGRHRSDVDLSMWVWMLD
ncbi:embryonic testis differentiation protein homolog B [Acinonyx jubatus]|uniref:Embryonic testis differentiation protein homolog A n=1 Tax=Acinonyx jubatus TaxID=32536 RepID=A0A6J1YZC6_ACIJB|nr:embryonic testis differentiation protein homolog B [Acinonyx jubatus]XP_053057691.1 embryonic testis differentiation protein homolog B [Acinonyx jubatus]XP_053057692.1 embryonic testis differentiation protein homolog B [Acinonyx jubatus]XP_053057693.1 embryonic testis differentiation protein homolog B [Acinonyx jubatus]XP_053057694.1 embryonic testis differentiation protein homolog B [Acinonyx jubatus]XP_053057695.1 embryonic testis differentiation protein homolog B [Acinonyx jubatus]XP_05